MRCHAASADATIAAAPRARANRERGSSRSSMRSSASSPAAKSAQARLKAIQGLTMAGDQRKSVTVPNQAGSGAKSHSASTRAAAAVAGRARRTVPNPRRTLALTSERMKSSTSGIASTAEATQTLLSSAPR